MSSLSKASVAVPPPAHLEPVPPVHPTPPPRQPWLPAKTKSTIAVSLLIVALGIFLVWPVGILLQRAFMTDDGAWTLEFFRLLFSNHLQILAINNSLMIGFGTTILATLVSLPLAILNHRYEYPGKGLLSGALLLPMIMPPFVGAIGIERFFARYGTVNLLLLKFDLISEPVDFLGANGLLGAVIALEVFHLYPIMYLNLLAAIANIDPSLNEMASTLGASRWQRARRILWPLARPGFFAGASVVFIWSMTDLGSPLLVGFSDTIPVRIYNLITDTQANPVGYAMVVVVVAITVAFFLFSKLMVRDGRYHMLGRGHVAGHSSRASLPVRCGIYALSTLIIGMAIIPHLSVLVTAFADEWFLTTMPQSYTLRFFGMVFEQDLPTIGIKNSLLFSSISTAIDLVLGVGIAYVVARRLVPFHRFLDILVMTPLALPGIVLAYGYILAFTGTILDPMLNPAPLLVISYAIRRLPYMVRAATAGLQQTSPVLEEAARLFGASAWETIRRITLPLVSANLIAGGLLCFSYAMLDVSDSLILAMKDQHYPMTKAIYALYLEHGTGEFVASALGVVAMAILAACLFMASSVLGKRLGELFRA